MCDFLRVLGLGRQYVAWILLATTSMVVAAGATVFAFNLVRPIFDQVLNPSQDPKTVLELPAAGVVAALDEFAGRAENNLRNWIGDNRVAILALAMLSIVIKNIFAFIARFASARFGLSIIRDLRDMFFRSLLVQSPAYFHSRSTAALVSRATHDLQVLREALAERLGDVAQDLVTVPFIVIFLLSLDFRLTLVTAVAAPLLMVPVLYFSRRMRARARRAQERTAEVAVVVDETVRGIRVVQNFGMAGFMVDRFRGVNHQQYLASLATRTIQAANAPVMEIVGAAAALALIGFAASQISGGHLSIGDFSAFVLAAYAVYNPCKRLNKFNLVLQQATVSANRVFEIIDTPATVYDRSDARPLTGDEMAIRFENVEFSYPEDRQVLHGLDLDLPSGSTVALVGASGAGKSTIAQLIPRFFDIDEGRLVIGSHDVRDLELASLRAQIGCVTQETLLFNDTIHTNIVCGRQGFKDGAVEAAARAAAADAFIRDLPHGYGTVIGEGGIKLSGGQRQRLAIARAVLTEPRFLILDEATSMLDPESEANVYQALRQYLPDRTILVIAHRLAVVRRADVIAVLKRGRIAELGTHDDLVVAGGLYRRMVEMQEIN